MAKKRPAGILAVGIINILTGLCGIPFLIYGLWSLFWSICNIKSAYFLWGFLPGLFFVLGGGSGIFFLYAGVLVLKLKEKGRKLSLYLFPLSAIVIFLIFSQFLSPFLFKLLFSLNLLSLGYYSRLLFILIVFYIGFIYYRYLASPKVKENFK